MHTLLQDLRYSLRQLFKNPGFTLTAVVSLALGIGATTAVFSVIHAALINPYPYPAADRIVRLMTPSPSGPTEWAGLNGSQVQQMRKASFVDAVLAMDFHAMVLTGKELPENVNVVGLIGNGFSDLGLPPILGRGILPSDAIDGQEPQAVAVLSQRFWQRHYFSDPSVVGKTLQLDHKGYTIIGVAAPRFIWYMADVYVPLNITQDPNVTFVTNVRLKPGVTHAVADAALQPMFEQFAKETPRHFPEHFRAKVEGLNEWVIRGMRGPLYLIFAGVGLLLAIGCGNVSILLLARGAAREHELAVRAAIGAHRGRILRQLLTESLLLAAIGAALGVGLSYGFLAAIRVLLPPDAFAPEVVIGVNVPVLVFSVAVALVTGVVFGLWPALQLSRTHVGRMMQSNARRVAGSARGRRTHNALIAAQIAMTLVLLTGAGSAIKGFSRLIHRPLGYDPHNVIAIGIPIRENTYLTWEARRAYYEQLGAKVAEVPGVRMAAITLNAVPPYGGWTTRVEILGKPASDDQLAEICFASPEYFPLLRIPVAEGRLWNESENHLGAAVGVVNRTLAQQYFPNGDAIGHSVRMPAAVSQPPGTLTTPNLENTWIQIVGIVQDSLDDGLRKPIKPAVYVPYTLLLPLGLEILVRSDVAPLTLLHAAQMQLASVNPDQQTHSNVEDLETWISDSPEWQQEHLAAWVFGVFAWLALALAAVGLYSVVTYTVAQRTKEFGIRVALGAQGRDVLRIVFGSAAVSVGGGIVAGLVLSVALNSVMGKWAEGSARDPVILLVGVGVMVVVAGVACLIPARNAAGVDPMTALRCE
jgi:predicted permease